MNWGLFWFLISIAALITVVFILYILLRLFGRVEASK